MKRGEIYCLDGKYMLVVDEPGPNERNLIYGNGIFLLNELKFTEEGTCSIPIVLDDLNVVWTTQNWVPLDANAVTKKPTTTIPNYYVTLIKSSENNFINSSWLSELSNMSKFIMSDSSVHKDNYSADDFDTVCNLFYDWAYNGQKYLKSKVRGKLGLINKTVKRKLMNDLPERMIRSSDEFNDKRSFNFSKINAYNYVNAIDLIINCYQYSFDELAKIYELNDSDKKKLNTRFILNLMDDVRRNF